MVISCGFLQGINLVNTSAVGSNLAINNELLQES